MLAEIERDVLHFLDRADLEGLQVHSRYLRDLVNRQARFLPLRCIDDVYVSACSAFTYKTFFMVICLDHPPPSLADLPLKQTG